MKKIFFVLLIALLVAAVVYYPHPPVQDRVKKGDLVEVKYTITLDNGTIFGTTDLDVARANNISVFHHGSYSYIVGESELYPLDDFVLGMTAGQVKQEHFVPVALSGTRSIPRYKLTSRMLSFPLRPRISLAQFRRDFGDVAINDTVRNELYFPWSFRILNLSENGSVRLEALVTDGASYVIPGTYWNSTLTDSWTGTIFLRQEPALGQVVEASWGSVVVTNFTDDDITVRRDTLPGAFMALPAGLHVVTNVTDTDVFVRPSRGVLKETPFTVKLELVSVRSGVRAKKQPSQVFVDTTAPVSNGIVDLNE